MEIAPADVQQYYHVMCVHGRPVSFIMYSTDQMQGIRQIRLPSRVNAFVSLYMYKPI